MSSPPDIATTMGFTSFGSKPHKNKRRKLSPSTAFTTTATPASTSASGSNTTPLALRRGAQQQKKGSESAGYLRPRTGVGERAGSYLDTTTDGLAGGEVGEVAGKGEAGMVVPEKEKEEEEEEEEEDAEAEDVTASETSAPLHHLNAYPTTTLPPKPPPPLALPSPLSFSSSRERRDPSQQNPDTINTSTGIDIDIRALRKGVRDQRGDVAFFDWGFVGDPWEGLRGGKGAGEVRSGVR